MANKKFNKVAALVLLATFGLTACDNEVVANPSDHDGTIIDIAGDEVYGNLIQSYYDGIRKGSLAVDVLDEVLYQYSVSVLGRYNNVGKKAGENEITLKAAAKAARDSDATVLNAFIKSHKAYWTTNTEGKRVNDSGEEVADDAACSESERIRIEKKWEAIEERIAEAMYDKISGGGYSYRNVFIEREFLASLRFDNKKVAKYNDAGVATFEEVLTPDVEPKDVWDNFLVRDNYQPNAGLDDDESENKITYVEDEIIPSIYRSLLNEQYILDETYNTLGRSYARKINAIAIANNDNYDMAAPSLMNKLVKAINTEGSDIDLDTFKTYANVYKGVALNSEEQSIANDLIASGAFVSTTLGSETYIQGTKYGDMMDNYAKIDDDPLLTDSSIESDFTGGNEYTKETGKMIKEREIMLTDYTYTGWFTKNSGVDGLPSNITTRLFNYNVSNALDLEVDHDRWQNGTYDASRDVNKFVAKINGKYYLKNNSAEQGDDENDILFYNSDSKTYYVVQIEEAVNFTKFSKTAKNNYAELRGTEGKEIMEEYVNQVLKVVANNDSYETLSKKHWLEMMNLEYHDTVVYEYFKSNFPELFED